MPSRSIAVDDNVSDNGRDSSAIDDDKSQMRSLSITRYGDRVGDEGEMQPRAIHKPIASLNSEAPLKVMSAMTGVVITRALGEVEF